jgi:hypothetical protein
MYYLVYKLISNPTLWIIKEDLELDYIFADHNDISKNKIEKYYIFENKFINNCDDNFKRFKILKFTKDYELLYTLG